MSAELPAQDKCQEKELLWNDMLHAASEMAGLQHAHSQTLVSGGVPGFERRLTDARSKREDARGAFLEHLEEHH
jgi:hypothetical protein